MLLRGPNAVAAVAGRCVVFRRDTSKTPTAYRRQVRNPAGHE